MKEGTYMSNTNYITEMLELKDNNIKFYENCYRKEKIKGIYYKVFDGVLSYKPTCCPKCGVIFDKKIEKHGFIISNIFILFHLLKILRNYYITKLKKKLLK